MKNLAAAFPTELDGEKCITKLYTHGTRLSSPGLLTEIVCRNNTSPIQQDLCSESEPSDTPTTARSIFAVRVKTQTECGANKK